MTNSKTTKRALLTSAVSLVLCFAMLLGTTFAWFTDSVTSANNIIKSGNLDVLLYHADKAAPTDTVVDNSTTLFDDVALWEPGAMVWEKLTVENVGSLALKYNLSVNITEISSVNGRSLADVLKVAVMNEVPTRENVAASATQPLATFNVESDKALNPGISDTFYVAIYWAPSANDNDYNVADGALKATLGVNLVATQLEAELDSFGSDYDKDAKYPLVKGQKIESGIYDENPALYDETLAEPDSEYIAIDFVKDGKQQWVVSKRSETVVVSVDGANARTARNYEVKDASGGKLWSIIRDLQNNEHTTVYLLPGTYNEGTTINVYSSMDIIGLGDKDSVKVVKISSSDSNRHLFNCNGTKADYIQVTLRNLYLDATANTTSGKDNAAVQSIRKTKVKCYDLTIVKGTDWSAVAFYVNGNNAVDGVKYPAYLYAENCVLNTSRTFGIVTTSGTYKFYHTNLTYNGGNSAYTTNSGSTLNKKMEADDWWETESNSM